MTTLYTILTQINGHILVSMIFAFGLLWCMLDIREPSHSDGARFASSLVFAMCFMSLASELSRLYAAHPAP